MNWKEIEKTAESQGVAPRLVAAEILQVAFLDALYRETASRHIYFQGGTSIRLLHGGWRYSEDLDFAVEAALFPVLDPVVRASVKTLVASLALLFGPDTCAIELKPKVPKGRLLVYWLYARWATGGGDMYRLKIEFAQVPVYRPKAIAVARPDLPLFLTPLVMAEDTLELLADKVAAVAGRAYVKGRDWFDMGYLSTVLKTELDLELLFKKFSDYRIENPLLRLSERLEQVTAHQIESEMDRFLPEPYRSRLAQDHYRDIRETGERLIRAVMESGKT